MIGNKYILQNKILNFLKNKRASDKLLIWGAGEHTTALIRFLKAKGIYTPDLFSGIIAKSFKEKSIGGVNVFTVDDGKELLRNSKGIIVSSYSFQEEIVDDIKEIGLQAEILTIYDKSSADQEYLFYWKIGNHIYFNYEEIPNEPVNKLLSIGNSSFQMNLNLREYIQGQIYTYGFYEKEESILFCNEVKTGNVVFDIGANIGYYTLMAASLVGNSGEVHSFEPSRENLKVLKENIKLNSFSHVRINPVAISDKKGLTHLYSNSDYNNGMKSIVQEFGINKGKEEIETISLDDYISENNIKKVDFIKCDIEGAEILAFKGGPKLLETKNAPDILFELNTVNLPKMGSSVVEVQRMLKYYGYKLYEFANGRLDKIPEEASIRETLNIFAKK